MGGGREQVFVMRIFSTPLLKYVCQIMSRCICLLVAHQSEVVDKVEVVRCIDIRRRLLSITRQ